MSAFYLWNPSISRDSKSVSFVLTNGDVSGMARDRAFVGALLREVEVEEAPESWTITRCRSKYFSEYLDGSDWRDAWPIVWRVTVTTAGPIEPKRRKTPAMPWREVDLSGEDWMEESAGKVMCLVVSDFSSEVAMRSAQDAVRNDVVRVELEGGYSVGAPVFDSAGGPGGAQQLQILLGEFADDFYRRGADYAERVLHICQENGGRVNASARQTPSLASFEGVEFSGDLTGLVAEQLATGRYRGREDGAPGDWLERAWNALPPSQRKELGSAIHQALTHPSREVRAGAVRLLDGNAGMVDAGRLLDLIEKEGSLLEADRGGSLVQLAAARATGKRGRQFRTSMARDPDYGIWVLASLAANEGEWAVDHIHELVTPTLDPNGARLTVLVYNLQRRPKVLRRAVVNLAEQQPALVPILRRVIGAEVSRPALREELLGALP